MGWLSNLSPGCWDIWIWHSLKKVLFMNQKLSDFLLTLLSVPVDCLVFFLVFLALVLFLKGCSDTLCGTIAICPLWPDSRQPHPACLVGKIALYTMAMLGNVRTRLSLRKLKPDNKEQNYAIYVTGTGNNLVPLR